MEFDEPFVYLCGVNSRLPYHGNLHLPMEKNPAANGRSHFQIFA